MVYHVLNRGNGRMPIFHKAEDFAAFERVLAERLERYLSPWPVERPRNWTARGNARLDEEKLGKYDHRFLRSAWQS